MASSKHHTAPTARRQRPLTRERRRAATERREGRLVLVVAPEERRLAMLMSAVRRRCADVPELHFERRLATRPDGPEDAEVRTSRRGFQAIDQAQGFLATWEARGHRFGLPASLREPLWQGRTVVVAAPMSVVADLKAAWPDVRVVRVRGKIDAMRSPLDPRACLTRMLGAKLAARVKSGAGAPVDASISCIDDLPAAVRCLTDALLHLRLQDADAPSGKVLHGSGPGPLGVGATERRQRKVCDGGRPSGG